MTENSEAKRWLRLADFDLRTVRLLFSDHPIMVEEICYHCEQAVEKYLKAFLVFQGVEDLPRIHDCGRLCRLCAEYDEDFKEILASCEMFTPYSTQVRYPSDLELLESDALHADRLCIQVVSFISSKMAPDQEEKEKEEESLSPTMQ